MKEDSITDALLREYLLGTVAEEEQERIENLFLTDPHTRERMFAIEQELVEDYLEDNLGEGDKEAFRLRYAQTDEQRRTLRINKSIKDWAVAEASTPQAVAAGVSTWSRLCARLRLKPGFVVPIAVTLVIAIVIAILLVNSLMEQRRYLAIQQELAQLNSLASLREVPQQMTSVELRPGTVRSIEPQSELTKSADTQIVELRLHWDQKEGYSTYQVEVRRVADDEVFTIPNLPVENVIRIRLPAHMLSRGHYQVYVKGIANDGSVGRTEEYLFAVND